MKEYTYTNKAYLGVKEGITPPAPQYLWLNSKDNKLYKFGGNGWEVTNNDNLYVADFTINDLESLSETNLFLNINARALIGALAAGKAIGIRQGNNESMSIASAYKNGRIIQLTVISSNGIMYKVSIDCGPAEEPEVADNETGRILVVQVIPIETSFAPFSMDNVAGAVEGYTSGVLRDPLIAILETSEPLFIHDSSLGVVPASYSITKQDGYPRAVDIDIVYNNGLYHIHWDITNDAALHLSQDTVSYTPLSAVYRADFTVKSLLSGGTTVTITEQFIKAIQYNAQILIPITSPTDTNYVVVTTSQGSISADSFSITIGFIYQTGLYSVVFTGNGTVPSQVTPKITVTDLILKSSSFKTINGASVLGTGNISTIQGLSNLALTGNSIGTVNDNGVLVIQPGELAGLSTAFRGLTTSNGVASLHAYYRNVSASSITDNIEIRLIRSDDLSNNEWEFLFSVDSVESIALDVKPPVSNNTMRWKEGEFSHTSLPNGYYRLRATYVINEVWAEIEKFS